MTFNPALFQSQLEDASPTEAVQEPQQIARDTTAVFNALNPMSCQLTVEEVAWVLLAYQLANKRQQRADSSVTSEQTLKAHGEAVMAQSDLFQEATPEITDLAMFLPSGPAMMA